MRKAKNLMKINEHAVTVKNTEKLYEYNGSTYIVEQLTSDRYQMLVWDETDSDTYGITYPSLIIKVLTLGTPIERK